MLNFLSIVSNPNEFGNGHKARQEILKREIEKKGHSFKIILNSQGLEGLEVKKDSILVLDLSNKYIEPKKDFFQKFDKSVGFDWRGLLTPKINIVIFEHPGYEYKFIEKKYVGIKYLIINEKFKQRNFSKIEKEFILISLGFSGKSSKYIEAIWKVKEFSSDPIIIASGVNISSPSLGNVTLLVNPSNFHELVIKSKLVVSNGGTTMVESLYAGKEVIPIPQNVDESRFLEEVRKITSGSNKFPEAIKLNEDTVAEIQTEFNGLKRVAGILLGEM
jgi:spore coat polysaccharide biosynthesis predicted glycosyltransferase SpsG